MSKHPERSKRHWQAQEGLINFLSFVCVGGTYGLIIASLIQAYILVSWLRS